MVSNASEDFPEPDRPVITTRLSRGMMTSTFLRLCSRAPRTWMEPAIQGSRLFLECSRSIWQVSRGFGSHVNVPPLRAVYDGVYGGPGRWQGLAWPPGKRVCAMAGSVNKVI